jgi:hypothetical protein
MKKKYIQPQSQNVTLSVNTVMAEPSLGIASGRFRQGEDEQLGKKFYIFSSDDEEIDFAHFVPWRDCE